MDFKLKNTEHFLPLCFQSTPMLKGGGESYLFKSICILSTIELSQHHINTKPWVLNPGQLEAFSSSLTKHHFLQVLLKLNFPFSLLLWQHRGYGKLGEQA